MSNHPALWPLFLLIGSNLVYQACSKSSSRSANAFAILTLVYLVSTAVSFLLFLATGRSSGGFIANLRQMNWANYLMGLAIIGLEGGFLCLYRAGWNISLGPIMSYTGVAIGLLVIGALFYHEHVGVRQILGTLLCLVGIALISFRR